MLKISAGPINLTSIDPIVICPIKNEIKFLPHFVRHYESLGVENFIFIDNSSTDGSAEWLLTDPSRHVFQTDESFQKANYGMNWVNEIIGTYCSERWALFVDCDEFLIFRDCEGRSLRELCQSAEYHGSNCVAAAMIDMYPKGNFMKVDFSSKDDIFSIMPYFDTEYIFRPWPRRFWDKPSANFNLQVLGGPRLRLLSSLDSELKHGAYFYTICNQVDRFINKVPEKWISQVATLWPIEMPALQKKPLNWITSDFRYFDNHSNTCDRIYSEFTSLLHFKLCDELRRRVSEKSILLSHYRRGLSYEQLRQAIVRWGDSSLVYSGSRKFNSSNDLLDVGLVGDYVPKLWREEKLRYLLTPPSIPQ